MMSSKSKKKALNENENVQKEHQRLLRALQLSVGKEVGLHGELKRLKESLVSISMRFNAALKTSQDDETILSVLRKEAQEGRTEATIAKKQSAVATEMIQSLKLEVNLLKKRLNEVQSEGGHGRHHLPLQTSTTSNVNHNTSLGIIADKEVDEMFSKLRIDADRAPPSSVVLGNSDFNQPTTFQQWKIRNYIYTADAPSGSEFHDKHTIDMLAELSSASNYEDLKKFQRQTKSSISKIRESSNEKKFKSLEALELPSLPVKFSPFSKQKSTRSIREEEEY